MSLPTITVIGNVQKIETKQTQSGKSITSMNVSCGEKNGKDQDGKDKWDNLYIKAEFWEKNSEFVSKYFKEGDAIIVTGKLVTTNYTAQDGKKVYETKFMFPQASFVPKSKDPQPAQGGYSQPSQAPSNTPAPNPVPVIDLDEENIPF